MSRFKVKTVKLENPHTGNPLNPDSATVRKLEKKGYVLKDYTVRPSHTGSDRYNIQRVLGSGGFGQVFHVIEKDTGKEFALKVVSVNKKVNEEKIRKEIDILQYQKYDCALKLHEAFREHDDFYIVTSYFNGYSLEDYTTDLPEKRTDRNFDDFNRMYTQLLHCIDKLHAEGIYHRDIKPLNIVLHDGNPKIIDFGESIDMDINPNDLCRTVGTPLYSSKYVILLRPDETDLNKCLNIYNFQDYWDLILTFYFIITGENMVDSSSGSLFIILRNLKNGKYNNIEEYRDRPLVKIINRVLDMVRSAPDDSIPDIRGIMNLS